MCIYNGDVGYGSKFLNGMCDVLRCYDFVLLFDSDFEDEGFYFCGVLLEKVIDLLLVWLLIGLN